MESDHLQQFLAEIEERICTCGAGHGSGEGHTDWCEWVEEYSCPPAPEGHQESPQAACGPVSRIARRVLEGDE